MSSKEINKKEAERFNKKQSAASRQDILKDLAIRYAKPGDSKLLLEFIKQLADYEKRLSEVIATEQDIADVIFNRKIAEAIITDYKGRPAGFAIFFYNFSTFTGKPGLYIEDLFVNPELRGKGIGKMLFSFIARIAIDRGCSRVEWTVLTWNELSIKFYRSMGAVPKDEWVLYKLSGKALGDVAMLSKNLPI